MILCCNSLFLMRCENNFLFRGVAIPKGSTPRERTEGCQTTCEAIARHVCYVHETCVPLGYEARGCENSARPAIALRDEGGCVLSRRRIVLSADEMYVRRTSRKRDTRRAKLVKARSSGRPVPSGFVPHFPLFRPYDPLLISQ